MKVFDGVKAGKVLTITVPLETEGRSWQIVLQMLFEEGEDGLRIVASEPVIVEPPA
jgi:hypothetical protein